MTKILLADDHPLIMEGISNSLSKRSDFEIVGKVYTGQEILKFLESKKVDIIISDVQMPYLNGIDAYKIIKQEYPDVKFIVLTMHNSIDGIKYAIRTGISGFIIKTGRMLKEDIINAIDEVSNGYEYYCKETIKLIISEIRGVKEYKNEINLTNRESQILKLIGKGFKSNDIANQLKISKYTVETYKRNIVDKVGLKSAKELLKYALQNTN
ncbi:response regulator transcription factor [Dokdonia sp.]|uniref:response regulator transcription factor n=1 Tax=Dokdonia sp. TaxID=2024995 RepID=UPI0032640875